MGSPEGSPGLLPAGFSRQVLRYLRHLWWEPLAFLAASRLAHPSCFLPFPALLFLEGALSIARALIPSIARSRCLRTLAHTARACLWALECGDLGVLVCAWLQTLLRAKCALLEGFTQHSVN